MKKGLQKLLSALANNSVSGGVASVLSQNTHSRGKGGKHSEKKPSGAAKSKRAAKKRNNIRKRKAK